MYESILNEPFEVGTNQLIVALASPATATTPLGGVGT